VMRRLKSSNADTERVVRLVRHQPDLFPPDAPDAGVRRWLRYVGPDLVADLFRLRFALWRGRAKATDEGEGPEDLIERVRKARRVARGDPALRTRDLAIGGEDLKELGLRPGPRFGEILEDLLERVIEDPSLNRRDRLLAVVREAWLHE
jgi:tRNA nucleotidyltransferase (CCA-adding enzyme)